MRRVVAALRVLLAADRLRRIDPGQRDLDPHAAALGEDPVDQVVVVADLGDASHDQLDLGAAFVGAVRELLEVAPRRVAGEPLEHAHHARQRQRHDRHGRVGDRRGDQAVEQDRVLGNVEPGRERRGEQAEAELARVHVGPVEPVGARVLVGNEDLGQRSLVHHLAAVVAHQRDHRPGAALEAGMEAPLLPLDEVAVEAEVGAERLADADRLQLGPKAVARADAGLVEVVVAPPGSARRRCRSA